MRVVRPILLSPEQKQALEQYARARSLPLRSVERARIILLAAAGKQDKEIAAELAITAHKAARWGNRYLDLGWAGLEKDAHRVRAARRASSAPR
jgi:DNA-binding CsgD family transcriptional regulator